MLLTHSKIRPSCNARMMFDTPMGKMMTAIISMAMVNPKWLPEKKGWGNLTAPIYIKMHPKTVNL